MFFNDVRDKIVDAQDVADEIPGSVATSCNPSHGAVLFG